MVEKVIGCAVTVMEKNWVEVWGGAELSVTVTMMAKVPVAVGVPEIVPVADGAGAGVKVSPGGNPKTVQVWLPLPPMAIRVAE